MLENFLIDSPRSAKVSLGQATALHRAAQGGHVQAAWHCGNPEDSP